jgi:ubiquinone/menaquinone biosynthesis C-methylase UbiE
MSRLLAALYDHLMKATEEACLQRWRAELLAPLQGRILEVGAGTGANLAHYPKRVEKLVLTEPDPHMRRRLAARGAEVVDASAEALPFPDGSFDAVVTTLVLCSVGDPDRALAELHRVLAPGGKLVFLEHVAAGEGTRRRRWQQRIDPLWNRIMGNCHLARHTEESIARAGFRITRIERESMRKAMPLVRPTIRGEAVRVSGV